MWDDDVVVQITTSCNNNNQRTLEESIDRVDKVCDVGIELLLALTCLYLAHERVPLCSELFDVGVICFDDGRALKLLRDIIKIAFQQLQSIVSRGESDKVDDRSSGDAWQQQVL